MIRQVISCDICKKEKSEVNHWFAAWIDKGIFKSSPFNLKNIPKKAIHVCGANCATIPYQRFLSHGTLDTKPALRPSEIVPYPYEDKLLEPNFDEPGLSIFKE